MVGLCRGLDSAEGGRREDKPGFPEFATQLADFFGLAGFGGFEGGVDGE